MIISVKFNIDNMLVGPASSVHSYIGQDQVVDGFKVHVELDPKDARMLLLTGTYIENPKRKFYQWIPLTSVSGMMLKDDPNGQSVKPTEAQPKK